MAALGEALDPGARHGLLLFLCRGLWSWARNLRASKSREEPAQTPSSSPTASCERDAVIHILVAMAIETLNRRRS